MRRRDVNLGVFATKLSPHLALQTLIAAGARGLILVLVHLCVAWEKKEEQEIVLLLAKKSTTATALVKILLAKKKKETLMLSIQLG